MSEAGLLLVRVNIVKQTIATVFVGVDSGQNHFDTSDVLMRITDREYFQFRGKQRIYTVVGYICETDTFGWDRKLNEVREGDVLVFKNAGAYGFSMSNNYNSDCRRRRF